MIVQRYPDGSEMTLSMLAGSIVAGALIGTGITVIRMKLQDRYWKNYYKKHDPIK